jgi:hypothetical protein
MNAALRWQDRPENRKLVRVKRHYWIDPGTNYQLAHLVAGAMPEGVHEADAVCEGAYHRPLLWPLIGEGADAVMLFRACPKCVDAMPRRDVTVER